MLWSDLWCHDCETPFWFELDHAFVLELGRHYGGILSHDEIGAYLGC